MKEMKNGIRQRPNGVWEGRYYDVDGKQHSLYGSTKAVVKDKLSAKRTEINQGTDIAETDLTVEQWGWEWLRSFKANKVRHSTMDNYDTNFRLHILPHIGNIKLKDLTALIVQGYTSGRKRTAYRPRVFTISTGSFTVCWTKQ